jgi:hypothetical protein
MGGRNGWGGGVRREQGCRLLYLMGRIVLSLKEACLVRRLGMKQFMRVISRASAHYYISFIIVIQSKEHLCMSIAILWDSIERLWSFCLKILRSRGSCVLPREREREREKERRSLNARVRSRKGEAGKG